MSDQDPLRLISRDDVPELADLMRAAEQRLPDEAVLERMLARLDPPPPPPAAPPTTPPAALPALKVAGIAAAAALLIGGAALLASRSRPVPPSAQPQPSVIAARSIEAPVARAPVATAAASPSASAPALRVDSPAPPPSGRAPAKAPSGPSELELIRQAERLVRSDPGRALELTRQHARKFPRGALSEEREVIAIEALARLGKSEDAKARAENFEHEHANSAHARRVGRATGESVSDAGADQKNRRPRHVRGEEPNALQENAEE